MVASGKKEKMWHKGRTVTTTLLQWLGESYSIHVFRSDRAVFGFRFSNRLLLLFVFLAGFMVLGALFLSGRDTHTLTDLSRKSTTLQANLSLLEDEISILEKAYTDFQKSVNAAFSEMPVAHGREYAASLDEAGNVSGKSVEARLLGMRQGMQGAMDYLGEFGTMLRSRQAILEYIPNRWPVVGGVKALSMEFGPNIHPVRGYWYLHKGVDISGGGMVVAAANGRVSKVGYAGDSEYGNYVEVEHRFGFMTKYGHLGRIFVMEGTQISAGEAIGTMGSTGLSTGTHVHFEIQLGEQVIDPASFLKISNTFDRWTGDRE